MAGKRPNNKKDNKSKPWNKNKNFNSRGRDREVEENVDLKSINKADLPHVITSAKTDNDPSWYTHIYPVVADYASLAFNQIAGLPFTALTPNRSVQVVENLNFGKTFPGILTIKLDPTIGDSKDANSGINIAAQQMYTLMRKANAGSTNGIDKTDVLMMVTAMDSAYMLYEELLRAYRIFGVYNYENRYMPDMLLQSLGFSNELGKQLANFRGILDLFAYQLASINIPDQFDFIHRHSWLFTNVYTDASSNKAQMYAYKPAMYYKWTEGMDDSPTYLEAVTRNSLYGIGANDLVSTLDQVQNAINTIMDPLIGSQDVGVMSADLAKAFGEAGMIKIMPVQDNEVLKPVFDREVLLQMMNATIYYTGATNGTVAKDITVNYSDLVNGPYLTTDTNLRPGDDTTMHASMKPMLNFIDIDTTPEMIMVATRLMSTCDYSTAKLTSFGTEIAHDAEVWQVVQTSTGTELQSYSVKQMHSWNLRVYGSSQGARFLGEDIHMSSVISNFDWAPTMYNFITTTINDEDLYTFQGVQQDVDNYLWVDSDTIARLNNVAVMSEFAVKDYNTGITK